MITAADRATPQSLTLEQQEIDMTSEGAAPTGKVPTFLPPASQPTEPAKRPTLSLPQAAHSARDKVKARA
jgi:hypothetical protein